MLILTYEFIFLKKLKIRDFKIDKIATIILINYQRFVNIFFLDLST